MNKEEIIKKLKNNWVAKRGGYKELERAKRIICPPEDEISSYEYDSRIKVIVDYLKI